jgi:Clp amino terminal domain, pathogenicity island component
MNVEIIKLITLLAAFRPEGLRVLATTGHIHHDGTRYPVIPLVVLVFVIAGVIYALRCSQRRRQAHQPDIWQQDQSRRYAAQSGDADPVFDRMANDGKRVVKQSEEEARSRRSDHIDPEHLLLGIAAEPETVGARSLALCGAPPQLINAAMSGHIGVAGGEPRTGKIPISPSGTSVLQHALRESERLGHDYVGTGHLALGCLTVSDGLAAEVLNNLGVTSNDLRQAVATLARTEPPRFSTKRAQWRQAGS